MSFNREEFEQQNRAYVTKQSEDPHLKRLARDFVIESSKYEYGHQWNWLGLPILQPPEDINVTQQIIWQSKPDVIIETGVAWGGSIVFYASLLELIGKGEIVGIDIKIPQQNVDEIMKYSFSKRIRLIEGSSVDGSTLTKVKSLIPPQKSVMVLLDSNHTHEHVLAELRVYGPMVTKGQYLVVCDTIIEDMPQPTLPSRRWGPGNNPKTALWDYLKETDRFQEDEEINKKLLISYMPNGYLRCIK